MIIVLKLRWLIPANINNKRTECELSQLVAAEGIAVANAAISNAAQRACRSTWREAA